MNNDELNKHIHRIASANCQRKHPDVADALVCVGAESSGPPCPSCERKAWEDYHKKQSKMHGEELSPEDALALRKRLGI